MGKRRNRGRTFARGAAQEGIVVEGEELDS
jgi:hypothetical protein